MFPIARLNDLCAGHGCYFPRMAIVGAPTVFANGMPVHRQSDLWAIHACGKPHGGFTILGSTKVFANGLPVARMGDVIGDMIECGTAIAVGSTNVFSGWNWLNKYADISKKGSNLVDVDSVIDAIDNIIKTRIGERPFKRDFGSRVEDYLFRPLSFSISRLILGELISSITKWENRVIVLPETSVTLSPDTRSYLVILKIRIKDLGNSLIIQRQLFQKGTI